MGEMKKLETPKILCGKCGYDMTKDIEEWFSGDIWNKEWKEYALPHRNRGHRCKRCFHYWLSSDDFVMSYETNDGTVFTWIYCPH